MLVPLAGKYANPSVALKLRLLADLDDAPADLIERARRKVEKRIAETEGKQSA